MFTMKFIILILFKVSIAHLKMYLAKTVFKYKKVQQVPQVFWQFLVTEAKFEVLHICIVLSANLHQRVLSLQAVASLFPFFLKFFLSVAYLADLAFHCMSSCQLDAECSLHVQIAGKVDDESMEQTFLFSLARLRYSLQDDTYCRLNLL